MAPLGPWLGPSPPPHQVGRGPPPPHLLSRGPQSCGLTSPLAPPARVLAGVHPPSVHPPSLSVLLIPHHCPPAGGGGPSGSPQAT